VVAVVEGVVDACEVVRCLWQAAAAGWTRVDGEAFAVALLSPLAWGGSHAQGSRVVRPSVTAASYIDNIAFATRLGVSYVCI
jgi:hypothetical protein